MMRIRSVCLQIGLLEIYGCPILTKHIMIVHDHRYACCDSSEKQDIHAISCSKSISLIPSSYE